MKERPSTYRENTRGHGPKKMETDITDQANDRGQTYQIRLMTDDRQI